MSNKQTFRIDISKELLEKLQEFPDRFEAAIKKGLIQIGDAIYSGVERDKPHWVYIKKEFTTKAIDSKWGTVEKYKDTIGKYVITTDKWQWVFAEYGAKPHTINVDKRKVLTDLSNLYGRKIEHPGLLKKPFVRKNVDEYRDKAKNIILTEIQKAWLQKSSGNWLKDID